MWLGWASSFWRGQHTLKIPIIAIGVQSEKLGEKYVLSIFLDIHNNNGVQQNNISTRQKVYSLGDCQSLYSSGIFLLKNIFHH